MDFFEELNRITEAHVATLGINIPASIRKPVEEFEGRCVECDVMTENKDDGDFICEGCLAEARAQQASDDRHNDPRHVPYSNLGRR